MKRRRCFFAASAALLIAVFAALAPAPAVEPGEMLANPQLEARARAISAELRCLVCRNESIDESAAPLAADLRLLVRERLLQGDSNAQVKHYIVARYGEYVLLRPPFHGAAVLLWLLPPLIFLSAVIGLIIIARRRKAGADGQGPKPLSATETAALEKILAESPPVAKDTSLPPKNSK